MRASDPMAAPVAVPPEIPSASIGDLEAARRVLGLAAEAIDSLARTLGGHFSRALDLLLAVRGRVIVSGMGKSGHIARKIAATLASTGTPAQFVHPAEASHGDLGAVTRSDAVMILSNSGETAELSDLITFAKRFSVPLIGIASRAHSTLLRAADVGLLLPTAVEACPMGLAPTTSTTLMLVLGDALAVALMERRGFTPDEYRVLHPGGSLGKSLIRVSDIMHKGVALPLVTSDTPMREALTAMTDGRKGCVGVINDEGRLVGIFTDGDLRRSIDRIAPERAVSELMTRAPKITAPSDLAVQALATMNKHSIAVLFVVDPDDEFGRPLGILHLHDCLRAGLQ